MSLSKIVQESVDETLEKVYEEIVCEDIGYEDFKSFFISSQISLLEAELERKKIVLEKLYVEYSKIKEYAKFLDTDSEDANRKKIQVNDERREQREISKAKFSVVEADITYLEEQIAECRKLLK